MSLININSTTSVRPIMKVLESLALPDYFVHLLPCQIDPSNHRESLTFEGLAFGRPTSGTGGLRLSSSGTRDSCCCCCCFIPQTRIITKRVKVRHQSSTCLPCELALWLCCPFGSMFGFVGQQPSGASSQVHRAKPSQLKSNLILSCLVSSWVIALSFSRLRETYNCAKPQSLHKFAPWLKSTKSNVSYAYTNFDITPDVDIIFK